MALPRTADEVFAAMWSRATARANGAPVPSLALPGSIAERWDHVHARVYGGASTATASPDTPAPASTGAGLDAAWDRVLARTNPTTKIEPRSTRWWEPPAAAQVTDAPVATTPTVEPVAASPAPPPVPPSGAFTEETNSTEPAAAGEQASEPEAVAGYEEPASVSIFLERCARFRGDHLASIFRR